MTSHQMVSLCVVVYFLMTVSSAPSSDCQDVWTICEKNIIRDTKSCDKQDYRANCKKTCGFCGDCQDLWTICGDRITKDMKFCDRQDYKAGCRKTCGLCAECSDIFSDCSKSNCQENIWKVYCRQTCNECVDQTTGGHVRDETATSTTTTTATKNFYPPDITSYTDKQVFSAGETVTLTCRSRNTGDTRGVLSWHSSRNDVRNITHQVSDGFIQLDILQIPTEYDGMNVTCVETGNVADTLSFITIRVGTWGSWSSWTCSVTCGRGTMSRTRTCTPPSATCSGDASQAQGCQRPACCVPRHGQWNDWGSWSSCSVSCGQGIRRRSRTCSEPNACGHCEGNNATEEPCNDYVCPGSPDMASLSIFSYSNFAYLRCFVAIEYAQDFELFKVTSNGTRITRNLTSSTNYVDFKLEKIQCEDAGIYFCTATKGLKIANSTSVQLNIPCYPRRPPGTPTTPERIEVMEGSGAQYTFTVIAHPVPTIEEINYHTEDTVSSLKKEPVRSDFISGNCRQNLPDLHLVTCLLFITDALRTDDGLYSLKVRNSKGHVNITFELSVIGRSMYLCIFYCLRVELSNL